MFQQTTGVISFSPVFVGQDKLMHTVKAFHCDIVWQSGFTNFRFSDIFLNLRDQDLHKLNETENMTLT